MISFAPRDFRSLITGLWVGLVSLRYPFRILPNKCSTTKKIKRRISALKCLSGDFKSGFSNEVKKIKSHESSIFGLLLFLTRMGCCKPFSVPWLLAFG